MTLNITKKKIEKVLELFNHPQTRKIRNNRGKKKRRNNKSFNRKNGRKNLATSTLKKRVGHPPINGGQVGVVLGGQVGGDIQNMKQNLQRFVTKYQTSINDKYDKYIDVDSDTNEDTNDDKKKYVLRKILRNLKSKFEIRTTNEGEELVVSPFYDNKEFKELIRDADSNADSTLLDNLLNLDKNEDTNEDTNDNDLTEEENIFKDIVFPIQLPILPEEKYPKMKSNKTEDQTTFAPDIVDNDPNTNKHTSATTTEENTMEKIYPEGKKDTSPNNEKQNQSTPEEVTKSKEIDTSEMLKVALASNYFTQYGILSGMLKINQEKDNNKFDVMKFVQDPKLYAEFCNKMGFQFAEMKEEPVVENKTSE